MFLSSQIREFHHNGRTDSENLINVFLLNELFYAYGHDTLFPIRAVVSHDDDLVARLADLIFEND